MCRELQQRTHVAGGILKYFMRFLKKDSFTTSIGILDDPRFSLEDDKIISKFSVTAFHRWHVTIRFRDYSGCQGWDIRRHDPVILLMDGRLQVL